MFMWCVCVRVVCVCLVCVVCGVCVVCVVCACVRVERCKQEPEFTPLIFPYVYAGI